jgi:hypothetical protein
MRTFVVVWDNGESKTIHGPWTTNEAAARWADSKAREVWWDLFDGPIPPLVHHTLEHQSGHSFKVARVVPSCEQPDERDVV